MCFRRAVCLCRINNLDIVIARRGLGARRRGRRGCRCRSRLNARAGARRGIGIHRAAGDCEGHGVAESQVFGNINCNPQNCFCLIIVHSAADFHILLGNKSQRLAFAELCGLNFIYCVLNIRKVYVICIDFICIKPQIFKVCAVRICGSDFKCNRLADCCAHIGRLLRYRGIVRRQRAHRHERNEHQRHHQQADNTFFHYVPPKF